MAINKTPSFAIFDPRHVCDGLFVPSQGVKNMPGLDVSHVFDGQTIRFVGKSPINGRQQGLLVALAAHWAVNKARSQGNGPLLITRDLTAQSAAQLRLNLNQGDDDSATAIGQTTAYAVMLDAGYFSRTSKSGKRRRPSWGTDRVITNSQGKTETRKATGEYNLLRDDIIALNSVQIYYLNRRGAPTDERGKNKRIHEGAPYSNLVSLTWDADGNIGYVLNSFLTQSLIGEYQHVRISLFERLQLTSEIAKILHFRLSSYIRTGHETVRSLDWLVDRVWPATAGQSRSTRHKRREIVKKALMEEIRWLNRSERHSTPVECLILPDQRRASLLNSNPQRSQEDCKAKNENDAASDMFGWHIDVSDGDVYIRRAMALPADDVEYKLPSEKERGEPSGLGPLERLALRVPSNSDKQKG